MLVAGDDRVGVRCQRAGQYVIIGRIAQYRWRNGSGYEALGKSRVAVEQIFDGQGTSA